MYQFKLFLLIGTLSILSGCDSNGFPVAQATGRVVCEGQPVPHVRVYFEPLENGKSALVGKQGLATADAEGKFVLTTYETGDGAVIGKHRVRVGGPHPEDFPKYSCPCVLDSEVDVTQVEVKKGKKNEFELVLKKRTGQEKPQPVDD